MKIAVAGLWHLGCVTAACLAKAGFEILGYDPNEETINHLQQGKPPIFEPGLNELLAQHPITYSSNPETLSQAEIVWVTFDTPVDDNDIADVDFVTSEIKKMFPYLRDETLILVSSQIPVGTTRLLETHCKTHWPSKNISFACSPENLRLGKAIEVFTQPERVIIGFDKPEDKHRLQNLFNPFTKNIIWMSIESAEMTKHALNAFLATSVVFINELSILCEKVGADAREVEIGLKSEARIGPKAYLRPGNAIAGGTLARDVNYLIQIGQQKETATPLFSALLESNHAHKQWSCRRIIEILKDVKNKNITTLGLAYKPGTDTLRRSTAVETCEWLKEQGANVIAYDPALNALPEDLGFIELKKSLEDALAGSDAILISTECPEFSAINADELVKAAKNVFVFDPSGFLAKNLSRDPRVRYFSVGCES